MNITKIKFDGNETTICYANHAGVTENVTTLKCGKPRSPKFTKAFYEIIPFVVRMLNLPNDWEYDGTDIKEIDISKTDKKSHYRITLLRKHPWFKTPLVIKTPIFVDDQMVDNLDFKLVRLQEHAIDFINGKREQTDMFEDESPIITLSTVDTETGEIIQAPLKKKPSRKSVKPKKSVKRKKK